jgi:DNA (cytosine-5)-methyltransferase 1
MGAPTLVSIFAGCGGSSLGYRRAGFGELLAIDNDRKCCDTFRLNFPGTEIWERDIRTVTGKEITEKFGKIDHLDGSPPCQGFSTAGRRRVTDSRNDLVLENIRLIREIRPRTFLIENVSGMAKGNMKGLFKLYTTEMKASGYSVRCMLMNAKNYGVPQSRKRLIWIGVRDDLGIEPSFPPPSKSLITAKDALAETKNTEGEMEWAKRIVSTELCKKYLKLVRMGENASKYHPKGHWFGFHRLHSGRPSPTVVKTVFAGGNNIIHWAEDRNITISELKRLCSFPDEFRFPENMKFEDGWGMLGNAVMPKFMEALARHIRETIYDGA